jgi:hypothetical protein
VVSVTPRLHSTPAKEHLLPIGLRAGWVPDEDLVIGSCTYFHKKTFLLSQHFGNSKLCCLHLNSVWHILDGSGATACKDSSGGGAHSCLRSEDSATPSTSLCGQNLHILRFPNPHIDCTVARMKDSVTLK